MTLNISRLFTQLSFNSSIHLLTSLSFCNYVPLVLLFIDYEEVFSSALSLSDAFPRLSF